jgi:hypothetical protein
VLSREIFQEDVHEVKDPIQRIFAQYKDRMERELSLGRKKAFPLKNTLNAEHVLRGKSTFLRGQTLYLPE